MKQILSTYDITTIEQAALDREQRAFIDLLMYTGMRPGEVYALTWDDIDFKHRVVRVNKALSFVRQMPVVGYPKTDSSIRTLPMTEALYRSLRALSDKRTDDRLFGTDNEYRTQSQYRTMFRRAMVKVFGSEWKSKNITIYCFRHTFCSVCYYSGISQLECQRLMGHTDYKMIAQTYAHLDSQKEATADKLERAFRSS